MTLIKCRTLYNAEKYVSSESLIHRPSVYGLMINAGQLLVAQAQYTKRYVLPGGGIEKGEDIYTALMREVYEETGIDVEVGEFLHFHTDFFYYDPLDLAMHGFLFYYHCKPLSTTLNHPDYPPEEGLDMPLWVDVTSLAADSFQSHGQVIMNLLTRIL